MRQKLQNRPRNTSTFPFNFKLHWVQLAQICHFFIIISKLIEFITKDESKLSGKILQLKMGIKLFQYYVEEYKENYL